MYSIFSKKKKNLPDFPTLSVPSTTTFASILCPFSLVISFRKMLRVNWRASAAVNKVKKKAELRRARSRDADVTAR